MIHLEATGENIHVSHATQVEGLRRLLVEACSQLGVNGFIATNVTFLVGTSRGPHICQIDHLGVAEDIVGIGAYAPWTSPIPLDIQQGD